MRSRYHRGLAVWIAYVTMLLPVSGLFHTGYQITTDRYSYLPCLGFAMLVGGAVAMLLRAAGDGRLRPVVAQAATAAIAAGAMGSTHSGLPWRRTIPAG